MALFATVTLGAALFGAYAADIVFGEQLSFLHEDRLTRISLLIVILGVFSAVYTYFGGLSAVVKTDIVQFSMLLLGGIVVCITAVYQLGVGISFTALPPIKCTYTFLPITLPSRGLIFLGCFF